MKLLKSPATVAAIAALLASTTGYCVLRTGLPDDPPEVPAVSPPVRLLPPAVIPFAPEILERFDDRDTPV